MSLMAQPLIVSVLCSKGSDQRGLVHGCSCFLFGNLQRALRASIHQTVKHPCTKIMRKNKFTNTIAQHLYIKSCRRQTIRRNRRKPYARKHFTPSFLLGLGKPKPRAQRRGCLSAPRCSRGEYEYVYRPSGTVSSQSSRMKVLEN